MITVTGMKGERKNWILQIPLEEGVRGNLSVWTLVLLTSVHRGHPLLYPIHLLLCCNMGSEGKFPSGTHILPIACSIQHEKEACQSTAQR